MFTFNLLVLSSTGNHAGGCTCTFSRNIIWRRRRRRSNTEH